ncbi:MAG: TIGR03663 family protein [Chloroflexota bacterium]|nr:TIGR03663 family protein [Chloroflexota bacterium]
MQRASQRLSSLPSRLRSHLTWESGFYVALAVVALVMRLWDLGARGISHDESLHGIYSWYLANGNVYHHDPMMHGPFLFHGTALNFLIFGDSDVTMRLLAVFLGTGLVVLPYFLRHQLGRWGAMSAAVLLAFSPTLLYYSRYARNDVLMVFWALLLVVLMWRYFEQRKARQLYFGAAVLGFTFCTKETSYITVAIFGLFLLVVSARELAQRVRKRFDLKGLSGPADYLILLGTLSLPLYSGFVQLLPGVGLPSGVHWVKVLTVIVLFVVCAAVGLRWNWRRWLVCVVVFYGVFALLYTSGFTNPSGFGSGLWGAVDYWVEQQAVARGGQPWFYYLMVLPVYEFLPLLFAAAGAVYYAIRGNLFTRFLIWWGVASLILFSYAGEKMPWLSVHIALPAILLAGMFIVRILKFDWKGVWAWVVPGVTVFLVVVLFAFTVYGAVQASYDADDSPPQMLVYAGISVDVPQIKSQIQDVAEERGEGTDIWVTVDSRLTWPWYWYLRGYENVHYRDVSGLDEASAGTVLLVEAGNRASVEPVLGKYGEGQDFRELLWFPEEYRDFSFGWWWRYFLLKDTQGDYWSTEGIAYFPESTP